MEMNVEKTKVTLISRQSFPLKLMTDQKQVEDVESFKYLGSMLTNDGKCTCEFKSRIAVSNAAFNKKKNELGTEDKTCKTLHLEYNCIWC
jgi:hypothetical protein